MAKILSKEELDEVQDVDIDTTNLCQDTKIAKLPELLIKSLGGLAHIEAVPIPLQIQPQLQIENGLQKGEIYLIKKPLIIIGRVKEVADVVLKDEAVSRHHAVIIHTKEMFKIFDVGSTNGVFVNGELASVSPLKNGDILKLGETLCLFSVL